MLVIVPPIEDDLIPKRGLSPIPAKEIAGKKINRIIRIISRIKGVRISKFRSHLGLFTWING